MLNESKIFIGILEKHSEKIFGEIPGAILGRTSIYIFREVLEGIVENISKEILKGIPEAGIWETRYAILGGISKKKSMKEITKVFLKQFLEESLKTLLDKSIGASVRII